MFVEDLLCTNRMCTVHTFHVGAFHVGPFNRNMKSIPTQPPSFQSPPAGPLTLVAQTRPNPGTECGAHVPEGFRFVPELSREASERSFVSL